VTINIGNQKINFSGLSSRIVKIGVGIGLIVVIVIAFIILSRSNGQESSENQIRADIAGAISKPGVYEISEGSIVEDLISEAGGLSNNVDQKRLAQNINRAALIEDGDKIYVPIKGEKIGPSRVGGEVKINLNTAKVEELELLPGVGPVTAARIINYRRENGEFKNPEDVINVYYINQEVFDGFKDLIEI